MKTIKEIFIEARQLISDPINWTQFAPARNLKGDYRNPGSNDACQWCMVGAIRKVENLGIDGPAAQEIRKYFNWGLIGSFNDSHSHQEVIKKFDGIIDGTEKTYCPACERVGYHNGSCILAYAGI